MKQMDWIGWTCWAVIGVSAAVSLWALFWDRAQGRLRCRKCAYDMLGGGLTCPECGREHKNEKSLRMTRRKWKTAVVGLLLIAMSFHMKHQRHLIYHEGPIGLVPTIALVLVVDLDEYYQQRNRYPTGMYSLVESVEHRLYKMRASLISRQILAWRLSKHWSRRDGTLVKAYDVSGIVPVVYSRPTMFFSSNRGANRKNELMGDPRSSWDFYDLLVSHAAQVSPEYRVEWVDDVGDQWVASASNAGHDWLAEAIPQIQNSLWCVGSDVRSLGTGSAYVFCQYDLGVATAHDKDQWYFQQGLLERIFTAEIRNIAESHNDRAGIVVYWLKEDRFLNWATPVGHQRTMDYLNSVDLRALVKEIRSW